ncbi:hypothetical protein BJY04DRAFT_223051 [Aspergillus karnatakaensis]|uniref:uncharacterized protein n=1 Tax=Aspergillus karnatakaensis TaxID=1810916 RepID=UPI003CCD690E
MIAVGAGQELFEYEPGSRAMAVRRLAMQQYGRALEILRCSTRTRSVESFLLCCALFSLYNGICESRRSCTIHVKSGLKLLQEHGATTAWSLVSHETMLSVFVRLDHQHLSSEPSRRSTETTSEINSIRMDTGSHDMYLLMDGVRNHECHHFDSSFVQPVWPSSSDRLQSPVEMRQALERWQQSTTDALSRLQQGDELPRKTPEVLQDWNILARISKTVFYSPGSGDTWDEFHPEFYLMVSLCESYLARTAEPSRKRTFDFSVGVIPALLIAALRCRQSQTRRRAIHLLSHYDRREGMWDSVLAAQIARQLAAAEQASVPEPTPQAGLNEPRARLNVLRVEFDDEGMVKFEL